VQQLAKDLGDEKWQNRAMAEIGFAAFYDGDIETSRKNVLTALLTATGMHDVGEQIKLLYAIGIGLDNEKKYSDALTFLDRAIPLSLNTPGAPYPFMIYIAKASALAHLDRIKEATKILADVRSGARKKKALVYEAATFTTSGEIDEITGDLAAALVDYRQAESLLKTGGYLRRLIMAQLVLANIYRKQGNIELAVNVMNQTSVNMQASGEIDKLPEQLRTLAALKSSGGRFLQADRIYDKAEAFVDAAIYSDPAILDKTTWINSTGEMYVQHFALLADHLGNTAKAFSVIEQVRGRVTTDLLVGGARSSATAMENERAISQAQLALRSANTPADIRRVSDRLFFLEQKRWITPEVSILKARARSRIPLAMVQRTLSGEAVILEYVLGNPNSYCLVITRGTAQIVRLGSRKQIEDLVAEYLESVKSRKGETQGDAHQLYEMLMSPLGEATRVPNLLIVRDGELHLLPFEALVDSGGKYVSDRNVVSYLPSAASFYLLAQKSHQGENHPRAILAVGGVAYGTDRDQLKNLLTLRGGDSTKLTDLSTSAEEIQVAESSFPGKQNEVLTGVAATESAFKQAPLSRFQIIHLAVHGLAEKDKPYKAALVLLEDRKAGEDGLLQAPEIAQLHLRADLVVLSACDTVTGQIQGQEGIETLAHSFVLAGSKSVISTLWSIDDNFSLALIKQFYEHYRTTGSPADSLALAKRDVLRQFGRDTNPFYWAAFTFEGVPKGAISTYDSNRKTD
jgi:CHAT domain-containing protein